MNQYNPHDNLSVQPAEGPFFYTNSPPPQFLLPPPTPPPQTPTLKKIPLIPLLRKHQESSNLQLACLQKGVYFSKSTLHTITNPVALDRELNLLQLADILQDITKSQHYTIAIYRNFFQYTATKDAENRGKRGPFFNPWQTPQLMQPHAFP